MNLDCLLGVLFNSSGPEVKGEPWQGAWKESNLEVFCAEDLPFTRSVPSIPQNSKKCLATESCLSRENCPAVERIFQNMLGKRKGDPDRLEIVKKLKNIVCRN